jgi:phage terminase large subunit-like protein
VVAVDPPVTSQAGSHACGIIGAGVAEDGQAYVLAAATRERATPLVWAEAAIRLYHSLSAHCIVAETSQGRFNMVFIR